MVSREQITCIIHRALRCITARRIDLFSTGRRRWNSNSAVFDRLRSRALLPEHSFLFIVSQCFSPTIRSRCIPNRLEGKRRRAWIQRKTTPRSDLSLRRFAIHKKSILLEVKLGASIARWFSAVDRRRSSERSSLSRSFVIAMTTDGLLRILLAYFSLYFRDVAYASTMARPLSRGRSYQSLRFVRVFSKVHSTQAIMPFFFVSYFDKVGAFFYFWRRSIFVAAMTLEC